MLSDRYDMNNTGAMVSEFRELLGDLRVICEEAKYRIDKKDYQDADELKELKRMFNILDKYVFKMMDEFSEL